MDEEIGVTLKEIKSGLNRLIEQTENPIKKEFLTINDVCDALSISKQTLWIHTKNGKIPSYRIAGRVLYKTKDIQNAITRVA